MNCEIVENEAEGKKFWYCRDHKVEVKEGCDCNTDAQLNFEFEGNTVTPPIDYKWVSTNGMWDGKWVKI